MSLLERGVRNVSVDNIELLCNVLGLPAHELLASDVAKRHKLDESALRAPRKARPYPASR